MPQTKRVSSLSNLAAMTASDEFIVSTGSPLESKALEARVADRRWSRWRSKSGIDAGSMVSEFYDSDNDTYTASSGGWVANTAYSAGDVIAPTGDTDKLALCTAGGTSHATTEPTWGQVNDEHSDGTAVWTVIRSNVIEAGASGAAVGDVIKFVLDTGGTHYGIIIDVSGTKFAYAGDGGNPTGTVVAHPTGDGILFSDRESLEIMNFALPGTNYEVSSTILADLLSLRIVWHGTPGHLVRMSFIHKTNAPVDAILTPHRNGTNVAAYRAPYRRVNTTRRSYDLMREDPGGSPENLPIFVDGDTIEIAATQPASGGNPDDATVSLIFVRE